MSNAATHAIVVGAGGAAGANGGASCSTGLHYFPWYQPMEKQVLVATPMGPEEPFQVLDPFKFPAVVSEIDGTGAGGM